MKTTELLTVDNPIELSIIIPVYNIENYIEKCLISCFEQDIDESRYEVIVINDGSADGSLDIVKKYADLHQNLFYYTQENGGQSSARNRGLLHAKGDYIWFVDGDDYILKECLGEIIDRCTAGLLDVLAFSYSGQLLASTKTINNTVISGAEFLKSGRMFPVPWVYIWSRSLLIEKRLQFLEGVIHEDNEFVPRAIYLSEKILYIEKSLYYYVTRENSTTQLVSAKRSLDLILVSNRLLSFTDEEVKNEDKIIFYKIIATCITEAIRLINRMNKKDESITFKTLKQNIDLWEFLYKGKEGFHKIEGILFFLNPRLYFYCDKLYGTIKRKRN